MRHEPTPFQRPTELADYFAFLSTIDCNYTGEYGRTAPSAFVTAWKTLDYFIEHTPTEEGKELLRQCVRNLHVAFECLEHEDDITGARIVIETQEMFRRCRKYIALSDE